jgi:molybdopterin synthase catalytic subunit
VNRTGLRDIPLDLDDAVSLVLDDSAGAVATFLGVVRNHSAGRVVTKLEYHAYPSMAERELAAIAAELEAEFPGARIACLHRVGTLRIGEAAVVCAVSSPHRDAAFSACRELIDRVKARVPIWKREHGPDGPYWVGWEDARTTS